MYLILYIECVSPWDKVLPLRSIFTWISEKFTIWSWN